MTRNRTLGVAALAALALAAPAATPAAPSRTFTVQASDFRFKGIPLRTTRGTHVFRVRNTGRATHDLRIAGKRTRLLRSGQTQTLRVTFRRKGKYAYICTVEGHAALGMKGVLRVR
jgi:plastocyanin